MLAASLRSHTSALAALAAALPGALAAALAVLPLAVSAGAPARARADAIALGTPADFAAAVRAVEQATGVVSEELALGGEGPRGRSFELDARTAERLLAGSHSSFRKAGVYLFRYERSYGLGGEKDRVGLLDTPDRGAVIRRVGTSSPDGKVTPQVLVAWLDALSKEDPFELHEIGRDYVAGTFLRAPRDPAAVARRCVALAPDLVGGRPAAVDLLAAEIRDNRTLYLIW